MIESRYPLSELTGRIIGCSMEVHKIVGNGFQEAIYQRALAIELELQGLHFVREQKMPIFYKGNRIGLRKVDFLLMERFWSS